MLGQKYSWTINKLISTGCGTMNAYNLKAIS